jgi:hypothetical protein
MRAFRRIAVAAALFCGLAGVAVADSDDLTGTVIRRQGAVLEIQKQDGKLVQVRTDGQTEFRGPQGRKLAMTDIETGAHVDVKTTPNKEGDRYASEVRVAPVRTDTSRNLGTKPDMRAIPHNPQRSPGEASGIVP